MSRAKDEQGAPQLDTITVLQSAIMIRGETGTGKELIARAAHVLSGRKGRFVAVNCGAIARTLVEAELFGYKEGAFSGAGSDRLGLIRAAHGGTLFLDEIAELPERAQVALLRVIQESEVLPVGATTPVTVDLRVVTATHRDLGQLVATDRFREDLYARLCGHEVILPPLRARLEDIGHLIGQFLQELAGDRAESLRLRRSAVRALFAYDWPRNVRELRSTIEATLSVLDGDDIDVDALPYALREALDPHDHEHGAPSEVSCAGTDAKLRAELVAALQRHAGNVSAVAREQGKARIQIRRWCKRLGLEPESFR